MESIKGGSEEVDGGVLLPRFCGNLNDRSRRMDRMNRESALRLNAKLHVVVSKLPAVIRDETHIYTLTHSLSFSRLCTLFFHYVSLRMKTEYIEYLLGLAESYVPPLIVSLRLISTALLQARLVQIVEGLTNPV